MVQTKVSTWLEAVRDWIETQDLTQREAALKFDITETHLNGILNAKRSPSDKLLRKMARVMGLGRDHLIALRDGRPVEAHSEPVGASQGRLGMV